MENSQEANLARVLVSFEKAVNYFRRNSETASGSCGFFYHNVFQATSTMYEHFITEMFKVFNLHKQKRGLKSSEKR